MNALSFPIQPGDHELYLLPLGGAGQIGMNLSIYGHAKKWLMIDCGITFAGDSSLPGIDIVLPDPSFIRAHRDHLVGLVLSHAHEDHLGAIPYLWSELQCPIYATSFTISVLNRKFREFDLIGQVPIHEVSISSRFDVGPFSIELINVTHSIPEANIIVLGTGVGTVIHTGDWKLDPAPQIGSPTDETTLCRLGDEGILALVGDSTNALQAGNSGSETNVRHCLTELFKEFKGRIAITCFASNVARLESITLAGEANNRRTALVGRSLRHIDQAARLNGYLKDLPAFLTEYEASQMPRDEVILICAGSQGEKRSTLARLAAREHNHVTLERGDVVIFSSKVIPGNEKSVSHIQNQLADRGIEIITENDNDAIHVSGHPAHDELVCMYKWIRPRIAVPVHGESRHQVAHARIAQECHVPHTIIPTNGTLIRLTPDPSQVIGIVPSQSLAVDGKRLIRFDSEILRIRQYLMNAGVVFITVMVTSQGNLLTSPQVSVLGLLDTKEEHEILRSVETFIHRAIDNISRIDRGDDDLLRDVVRRSVLRFFKESHGKKPMIKTHLIRTMN